MRSAPTSEGLSTSTAIPVFTPISTKSAFFPKYTRDISPSVQLTGGTTELMITPVMSLRSSPARVNRLRVSTPYSSRSEEHTSELQSHSDLVCRLLLEKKKTQR